MGTPSRPGLQHLDPRLDPRLRAHGATQLTYKKAPRLRGFPSSGGWLCTHIPDHCPRLALPHRGAAKACVICDMADLQRFWAALVALQGRSDAPEPLGHHQDRYLLALAVRCHRLG